MAEVTDAHHNISSYLQARKERDAAAQDQEVTYQASAEEARARGAVDFNFFAGLVVPTLMRTLFPPFYLTLFNLLIALNSDPYYLMRFALGLPRGFAKTTFLKILVCWFIVYDRNHFIVIVCATESKALDFISDVDDMLASPQVEAIYGRWSASKVVDNAKRKIGFMNSKKIIMVPFGANTKVRGLNINNQRPDLIICDDIQDRDGALSPVQNATLQDWFVSSLVKSIATYGSNRMIIFLGNMYPGDCLLQMLKKNPEWTSLITGAILEDGESLWPELKPVRVLLAEFRHDEGMGLAHVWFAEVQNDPLDEKYRLLSGSLPTDWDKMVANVPDDYCFLTVDPAGFRKKSDDNVVAVHKVYDGFPICTQLVGGNWSPQETVKQILTLAITEQACVVGIEAVAYQQSLVFWVDFFVKKLNISGLHIVELSTNNKTKLSRIQDYIKELLPTETTPATSAMTSQARVLFTYYAGLYKLERSDNRDDYLDAPAYQKQLMTKYKHLLGSRAKLASGLNSLPEVIDVDIGV